MSTFDEGQREGYRLAVLDAVRCFYEGQREGYRQAMLDAARCCDDEHLGDVVDSLKHCWRAAGLPPEIPTTEDGLVDGQALEAMGARRCTRVGDVGLGTRGQLLDLLGAACSSWPHGPNVRIEDLAEILGVRIEFDHENDRAQMCADDLPRGYVDAYRGEMHR